MKKFNTLQRPVILFSPLDWGLGHATRCIPLIHELRSRGCEVIIGTAKNTLSLLKQEFPDVTFVHLPGYDIRYSRSKLLLIPALLFQIPRVLLRMRSEKKLLHRYLKQYNISLVISDNRFGLRSSRVTSVYITHQLNILTPFHLISKIATAVHQRYIKRFDLCWVPDFEKHRLAGKMSSSKNTTFPIQYLGPLSRFQKTANSSKYRVCIIISGPEPQRSIFERIVLNQISSIKEPAVLIRGLPGKQQKPAMAFENLQVYNHLPAAQLNIVLEQSDFIISRSGYTTVMDMIHLQKRALFVPTPGQYEQEYLASTLYEKRYFLFQKQSRFSLKQAIFALENFEFLPLPQPEAKYKKVIEMLLYNNGHQPATKRTI